MQKNKNNPIFNLCCGQKELDVHCGSLKLNKISKKRLITSGTLSFEVVGVAFTKRSCIAVSRSIVEANCILAGKSAATNLTLQSCTEFMPRWRNSGSAVPRTPNFNSNLLFDIPWTRRVQPSAKIKMTLKSLGVSEIINFTWSPSWIHFNPFPDGCVQTIKCHCGFIQSR